MTSYLVNVQLCPSWPLRGVVPSEYQKRHSMTRGQGSLSTLAVAVFSVCTRARSVAATQTFSLMCALLLATCAFTFAQNAGPADDKDKVLRPATSATPAFT